VNGFIATEEDAERVSLHIARLVEDGGAEPVQWLPWLVLDYAARFGSG
jgi:hypothetical protein